MSKNPSNRNVAKNRAKIDRTRQKTIALRDWINVCTATFLERYERQLAWWQRASRKPIVYFPSIVLRVGSIWVGVVNHLAVSLKRESGRRLLRQVHFASRTFTPRIESLEERVVLAHFQVLEVPVARPAGDARIFVQDPGTASGSSASYSIDMTAGQGSRYPEIPDGTRWNHSNGSFTLGGAFTVTIIPDPGEQIGNRVRIDLNAAYSVSGGTGAGVSEGHTDTGWDISVHVYGPTGTPAGGAGQGSLFSGHRSAKLINESPTSQITDFDVSPSTKRSFEARIGDTVSIPTSLFGRAATWQGGFTGLARGAVTGGVSYELSVASYTPDLVTSNIVRNKFPLFDYSVSQDLTRAPKIGLFWSEDTTYNRDTDPAADQLRTGHIEAGSDEILFSQNLHGWDAKYQYLLFIIDPFNEIAEVGEDPNATEATGNNVKYICVLKQPEIKLTVSPNAEKGKPYDIQLDVTNNSLIADGFNIQLNSQSNDQLPNFTHSSSPSNVRFATIAANEKRTFEWQVTDSWDWIDKDSPLLKDFALDVGKSTLWALLLDAVKQKVKNPGYSIGVLQVGILSTEIYEIFNVYGSTPNRPTHLGGYSVSVLGSQSMTEPIVKGAPVTVKVKSIRQDALGIFETKWANAKAQFAIAQSAAELIPGIGKVISLIPLQQAVNEYIDAESWYSKATDPPDPNYKELVLPQPVDPESIPKGEPEIVRNIFLAELEVRALQVADTRSQDRADGARLAGDYEWVERHLSNTVRYASEAALVQTRVAGLRHLARFYSDGLNGGVSQSEVDDLAANGFSTDVVTELRRSGMSDAAIEDFRQWLVSRGPYQPESFDASSLSLAESVFAASSSMADLEESARIRVEILGGSVSDLPADTLARYAMLHDRILRAVEAGEATDALLRDVETLVRELQHSVQATNSYAAIEQYLNDAYAALIWFQSQEHSPAGLVAEVDDLVSAGELTEAVAAPLRHAAEDARTSLAAGGFGQAAAALDTFDQLVENGWGTVYPASAGNRLLGYVKHVYDLLVTGATRPGIDAQADRLGAIAGLTTGMNPLANDTNPTGGSLRLLSVSTPMHGTAAIDDAGTPADPTDNRVVYTPGASFTGTDPFTYYVTGDGVVGLTSGQVSVRRELAVGQEYAQAMPDFDRQAFFLQAEAGKWYRLETLDASGYVAVEITAPDESFVSSGVAQNSSLIPFLAGLSGEYRVQFESYFGGSVTFRLVEVPGVEITMEQEYGDSLPQNDLQPYTFQAEAGNWYRLQTLTATGARATAEVYNTDRSHITTGTFFSGGQMLFYAPTTGPYEIVLSNESYYGGTAEFTFRLVLIDGLKEIIRGQSDTGTLNPPPDGAGRSEILYRLKVTAGESFRLMLPPSSSYEVNIGAYGPGGALLGSVSDYSREVVVRPQTSGEVLIAVYGSNFSNPVEYQFIVATPLTERRTIAIGDIVTGSVAGTADRHLYTFTGSSGMQMLLDQSASGNVSFNLHRPDGQKTRIYSGLETLLADGQYELEVLSVRGASDYRIRLREAAVQTTIAVGEEVSSTFNRPTEWAVPDQLLYKVSLTEGQELVLNTTGTPASSAGQGFWSLLGPNATFVGGGDLRDSLLFTVPATGTYFLLVEAYEETAFSFLLALQPEPISFDLNLGEAITGSIDMPGRLAKFAFIGSAGLPLYYEALDRDFDRIVARLRGPDGRLLWYANADLDGLLVLPLDGDYVLEIDAQDADAGDFSFRLSELSNPPLLSVGQVVSGVIDAPRSTVVYAFDGLADQRLLFDNLSASETKGGNWILYGADGWNLNKYNDSLGTDFAVTLPKTGRYFLALEGRSENAITYEFKVTEPVTVARPLTLGVMTSGEIVEAGERHVYTFTGSIGQVLYYDSIDADLEPTLLRLIGPDGDVVAAFAGEVDGPAFVLPMAGEYRLSVTNSSILPGDYAFRMLNVSAQTAVPLGEPVSGVVEWQTGNPEGSASSAYRLSVPNATEWILNFALFSNPDPYVSWTVYDASTATKLYSRDSIFSNATISFPRAGEYVLVFEGASGESVDFRFQVDSINHAPTSLFLSNSFVNQDAPEGTAIGQLSTSDADPTDIHSYAIVIGQGDSDNAKFSIVGNQLRAATTLNFATGSFYTIRIRTTDQSGLSLEQLVLIRAMPIANNDTATVLSNSSITVDVKDNDLHSLGTTLVIVDQSLSAGSATVVGDSILFNPSDEFRGIARFTYQLQIAPGVFSNTSTVSIGVAGSARQNPWMILDVDSDGNISPLDVLVIINLLNSYGPSIPVEILGNSIEKPFYDTDGDGFISPLDVLSVINHLNSRSKGEGEEASVIDYPTDVDISLIDTAFGDTWDWLSNTRRRRGSRSHS